MERLSYWFIHRNFGTVLIMNTNYILPALVVEEVDIYDYNSETSAETRKKLNWKK